MTAISDLLKGTTAVYTLTVEVRRPHSGAYVSLVATGRGASGEASLKAFQLTSTPISQDILAEFESDLMCTLEDTLARMVGVQELLGIES